MASKVAPVPAGYHTVTPYISLKGASKALEFYQRAFGAEVLVRMDMPDGRVGHAEIKIGDSIIFLSDEMPMPGCARSPQTLGATTGGLYLYVEDVDKAFQQAVDAGGKVTSPVTDMFWGDRHGAFTDPFGHTWSLSTHTADLSPQQIDEGAKKWQAQMAEQAQKKSA